MTDEDAGGGWLSDLGHGVLDLAGLVPVVGEVADLANAGWYAAEGDYLMAGLSAAAAVPFAGWAASALKGAKYVDEATDALTTAGWGADDIPPPTGPSLIVKPNGETVIVPTGATGPHPAQSGAGFSLLEVQAVMASTPVSPE